ncbi:MAG TPA: nickel pincer cofactor biosynthesis protein LarC [Spirochaetia bacterium]|nr:nickel pincer cofactor biosynthesis protein LarC [Spirochaetia bacterium]
MKIAYFDCFAGISGDMCLGALVDAGVDFAVLREELAKLPVDGYEIRQEKTRPNGITAENIFVEVREKDQPERHLADIEQIIGQSSLPEDVKKKSMAVFQRLAVAEAHVHDTLPERIHFHEVGAVDAIVDVVGTVLGLSLLGVEKVYASPLPLGKGFIECRHGIIPSPAPATLEVLKNVPVYGTGIEGELVTPTGAALAFTLASEFIPFPPMVIETVGYGSGKKKMRHPNLLRLVLGQSYEGTTAGLPTCHRTAEHAHTHGHVHTHAHAHGHDGEHEHRHGPAPEHDHPVGHERGEGHDQPLKARPLIR